MGAVLWLEYLAVKVRLRRRWEDFHIWMRVSVRSVWAINCAIHTNEGQPDQACNTDDQAHHIEQEVLVVVHANTRVHPWTVAMEKVSNEDTPEKSP